MELRSLIESLQRLYLDPRVGPTTEVRVELGSTYISDRTDAPLTDIAINGSGRRSIVLSALPRRDAFAR